MGLDLIVEGCAKPGHEREWRQILERSFAGEKASETEVARFQEISIPAYERLGAPRVGFDAAADKWLLEARKPKTPEEASAVLKDFNGYYVVRLIQCDGVPKYSHGDMYEGADATSFRGAFLNDCSDVLAELILSDAWNHKLPEQAVAYGMSLLVAADAAESGGRPSRPWYAFLTRLFAGKRESLPLAEQLDIVRSAGRWYIYWGTRGHAIRAWF